MAMVVVSGAGCIVETSTTTTTVDTNILDTQISGPITNIPVHITTAQTPHTVTLAPFCSVNTKRAFAGDVTDNPRPLLSSFYPIDTVVGANGAKTLVRRIPDHNLRWASPSVLVGGDLDITGDLLSFCTGLTLSSSGGSMAMGFHANVGLFGAGERLGARFETGFDYNSISSRTASVAVTTVSTMNYFTHHTSLSSDTAYFLDEKSQGRLGYFVSLTLNSTFESSALNVFVQGAFHYQKFFEYTPSQRVTQNTYTFLITPPPTSYQTKETSVSSSFFSLAPGFYWNLSNHVRLVSGARLTFPVSDNIAEPQMAISPFARIDFIFGGPPDSKN